MNRENFFKIIELGFVSSDEDPNLANPAALVLDDINNVKFTSQALAGLLASVVDCIVNQISEDKQIDFEKDTLKIFNRIVKHRHEHVEKMKID